MGRTITEKILARVSDTGTATAGETIRVAPHYMLAYDFPGYTDRFFRQMEEDFGIEQVDDPSRYVMFIDHLTSLGNEREQRIHDVTRKWAEQNRVTVHEGQGIGHQVAAELGYALPGNFLIHFDGHISGLGAFGALGMGVRRDLLEGWVTGHIYLEVPETIRFELSGEMPEGVDGRDLIHHIISRIGADGAAFKVMEFTGPGARAMPIDMRQSLCGMAMFAGGVSAIFNPDDLSLEYSRRVATQDLDPVWSDPDATYADVVEIDLSVLRPQVVRPGSARADNTVDVDEVAGTPVNRAFIGSCVSGRLEDIRAAASVLHGRKIAEDVQMFVVPTSTAIHAQAEAEGLLDTIRESGAHVIESTCDFCFGYAQPLQPGEVCISTGVLNIRGRMGSTDADIYMGSAATVAASAVRGRITDPHELMEVPA